MPSQRTAAVLTPAPTRTPDPAALHAAVAALRTALLAAPLPLPLDGVEELRADRAAVLEQLDDYVLPRLAASGRPPLVVVGGPTGVGKSTLVNSVLGERVTRPGSLRPTTRSPVLVHHPAERSWFAAEQVLPTLDRVAGPVDDPGSIQVVASQAVPRGLALMDAPDFDSVEDRNRSAAARLLAAADVWLFVTSASRYSDQLPWRHLERALERDLTVVIVMNRIPAEDLRRVSTHLRRMLAQRGFPADRSFFVLNGPVDDDGALPPEHVAEVTGYLHTLAAVAGDRSAAVRGTLSGAVRHAAGVATTVAAAAVEQATALADLVARSEAAFDAARGELHAALGDGSLVTGQFASQWHDLTGVPPTGTLAETFTAVRARLLGGGPAAETDVRRLELALNVALEHLVVSNAESAARAASVALRGTAHAEALLAWSAEDLSRPGRGLRAGIPRAISGWQQQVLAAVRQELVSNDMDEGLGDVGMRGLALAIAVHAASTPGLLGARAAAEERFGLRGLLLTAAQELARTLDALLAPERRRYVPPAPARVTAEDAARLRAAAADVTRVLADDRDGA